MKLTFIVLLVAVFFNCKDNEIDNQMVLAESPALLRATNFNSDFASFNEREAKESQDETITQKLIKKGSIEFESSDIEKDYESVLNNLEDFGAYLENENQSNFTQRINYELTIRVPSDNFDSLFLTYSTLGIKTDNKSSNVEDVTERFYDLKTRIKNKQILEQRYLDLLNKATKISDILDIERNINSVRIEIERMQGQLNYLTKQINYSTIRLYFYEVLPYSYESSSRKGFGARILTALSDGWYGLLTFLVGIVRIWPFLLITAFVAYLFLEYRKKRSTKTEN